MTEFLIFVGSYWPVFLLAALAAVGLAKLIDRMGSNDD